jgi:hypothetical protein
MCVSEGQMKQVAKLSLLLLSFILVASAVQGYEVMVFENYDTSYYLKNGVLTVEKELSLKNVGNNPIIPGEIHFRVYESNGDSETAAEITELTALTNNRNLESRVETYDGYADVVVHVWNPILPGFEIPVSLSYDMKFRPRGILFHEVVFPIEETTIPIRESSATLYIPKRFSVTYAPFASVSGDSMYDIIEWDETDDLSIEYTILPFPKMPFRMVSLFWLVVLMILGTIFIFLNMKRKK